MVGFPFLCFIALSLLSLTSGFYVLGNEVIHKYCPTGIHGHICFVACFAFSILCFLGYGFCICLIAPHGWRREVLVLLYTLIPELGYDGKIIQTGILIIGNVLFQYYFSLKSVGVILSFLLFAVSYLANLCILHPHTDMGFLNFLLSISLNCAVNLYGLRVYTWLVLGACVAIFGLRYKLDSISIDPPPTSNVHINQP